MNKYPICNIACLPRQSEGSDLLKSGVFIIVLNAKKTPPHLAISVHGNAFSLTVNGPKINWNYKDVLKLVNTKKIKTLFFKLADPDPGFTKDKLFGIAEHFTTAYPKASAKSATCLFPLKHFCGVVYQLNVDKVHFIFNLLPLLYESSCISNCYQMNMDEDIENMTYLMEKYTMQEINDMIQSYQIIQSV